MADLLLAYDRFTVMYDVLALLNESVSNESSVASSVHLSASTVKQLIAFMMAQGFVRTAGSYSEFKITTLGEAFLHDFCGMRKFLS